MKRKTKMFGLLSKGDKFFYDRRILMKISSAGAVSLTDAGGWTFGYRSKVRPVKITIRIQ